MTLKELSKDVSSPSVRKWFERHSKVSDNTSEPSVNFRTHTGGKILDTDRACFLGREPSTNRYFFEGENGIFAVQTPPTSLTELPEKAKEISRKAFILSTAAGLFTFVLGALPPDTLTDNISFSIIGLFFVFSGYFCIYRQWLKHREDVAGELVDDQKIFETLHEHGVWEDYCEQNRGEVFYEDEERTITFYEKQKSQCFRLNDSEPLSSDELKDRLVEQKAYEAYRELFGSPSFV